MQTLKLKHLPETVLLPLHHQLAVPAEAKDMGALEELTALLQPML